MKILIPASEGKAKVSCSSEIKFQDTSFIYEKEVRQVVNLLELIDEEDLRSIYGTTNEKSILFDGKGGCFLESGRDTASIIEVDMFTNQKPTTKLTESTKDNLSKKLDFEKERLSKWL